MDWISIYGLRTFIKTIAEELADEGKFTTSQTGDTVIGISIFIIGTILIVSAAIRSRRRAGLFSVGLAGIFGLSICMTVSAAPFNHQDLTLLAAPLGLIMAALVYMYARDTDAHRIGVILGMGILNAVSILLANQV